MQSGNLSRKISDHGYPKTVVGCYSLPLGKNMVSNDLLWQILQHYVCQMFFCMSKCNVSVPSFDLLGSTILLWFMRICTEHETKFEHDRSHSLLKIFLRTKKTKNHLSTDCIAAIIQYADALIGKEKYLSNHHRQYITNCMDSATTSPVESQNQIVHGHLGVRTNLNIEKGI